LKQPNPWGLHDIHGNVFEWVWDWFGLYPNEAETDPAGASSGAFRLLRGGSWVNSPAPPPGSATSASGSCGLERVAKRPLPKQCKMLTINYCWGREGKLWTRK